MLCDLRDIDSLRAAIERTPLGARPDPVLVTMPPTMTGHKAEEVTVA